jgi:uncharacterized protein YutE (UPF0331/DUF86 family)
MVDPNTFASKLKELTDLISRLRSLRPEDAEILTNDRDTRELVAYNLVLAVQAGLDIASHLIADEGWEPAATASESFQILAQHGVITNATAAVMGKAAGLRNLLVHTYSKAVPVRIHAAATSGLADLERFGDEVSSWVRGQS